MKINYLAIIVSFAIAFPAVALSAGPDIFLQEEPETYLIIDKLQGLGYLPDLMTGDRPLEAREVALRAEDAEVDEDLFEVGMLRFLRMSDPKGFDFRVRGGLSYSDDADIPPNAQGLPVPEDGGARIGGFVRAAPTPWIGLQARGDVVAGTGGQQTGRLEETSLRLGWPQATLEAGRFSLWWGPGRHGSLLFTTNAEPLTGVRLRNPRPIRIGGWFRFLGLFQYDLFAVRLEENRPIPHPLLSGIRLALKPASWLELGASRSMQFGGEGRDESFSTFLDLLVGKSESEGNTPVGNSLVSFDAKFRIPLRWQPIVFYAEAGAEDQSGSGFPSRWALLAGIFLPSIGKNTKADLRIEFADDHDFSRGQPGAWYRHIPTAGGYAHTYRGQILGHPMGTDARNLFLETHYFFLPSSFVALNLELTQRYFPPPAREEQGRIGAAVVAWLTKNVRVAAEADFTRTRNEGGVEGADSRNAGIQLSLAYQYR